MDTDLAFQARELYKECRSYSEVGRLLGISRQKAKSLIDASIKLHHTEKLSRAQPPKPGTEDVPVKASRLKFYAVPPDPNTTRRFIFTSAQNNTKVNEKVWLGLRALADYYDARLVVGRYVYNKEAFGNKQNEKLGKDHVPDSKTKSKKDKAHKYEIWYDSKITPWIEDENIEVASDLVWLGRLNVIPTASRPLSGFSSFSGQQSSIIPHAKCALESVATPKNEPPKMNYTTGTITVPNYVQRAAGQKAEFHHSYGALLVELDSEGDWFARQILSDSDGVIYDLDLKVQNGRVNTGHRVEAINWGDIHVFHLEDWMFDLCWGKEDSIINTLKPKFQFMHDTLDWQGRSHHDRKNVHEMYTKFVKKIENIDVELSNVVNFLHKSFRDFCQTVMVDSNHDNAFMKWLRECDYKEDHINALAFLKYQYKYYQELNANNYKYHLLPWALQELGLNIPVRFLSEDDSFVICATNEYDGIECSYHGHLGINGARGSPLQFTKLGRKMNTGHTHSASIYDGVYTSGVTGNLDQVYNRGMSSWSHSHIITYPNGKRAIITIRKNKNTGRAKWRAEPIDTDMKDLAA